MTNRTPSQNAKQTILGLVALATLAWTCSPQPNTTVMAARAEPEAVNEVTHGTLVRLDDDGALGAECPLKHTDVQVSISGFLSRVTVTQQFENRSDGAIEAIYVFPLSQRAAVDDMTMRIGDRTVKGKIKRREEARRIYDAARAAGQLASLLDQERPNIFTQSVANIPPGARVEIEISYVETLKYEEGSYEFSFPMVVGPRYIPGNPTGSRGRGWAPDTDQVPDAARITPPVAKPETRAGHDLSLAVSLDAGVPVTRISSKSHEIVVDRNGKGRGEIRLRKKSVLPNKDFVLRYDVAGPGIEDAVLAHHGSRGGFFTLILQPPKRVTAEDVTPKELVFVLDTSGSMSGFPIEKAKEVIQLAIGGLYPRDTFNLITFAGSTHVLFPGPVPATAANIRRAQEFLQSRQGGGGTEMMKAIRTALEPSDETEHVRIVCFLTDGYVGNDLAILGEVRKHSNARVFSFGVGNSVNRFLLDKMAEVSRGEVEYVALNDDGSAAARRFHERVRNPLLTGVSIDWGGLPVADVYPRQIPDLFSAKPVIVTGRYTAPARGSIQLRGVMGGERIVRTVPVDLPADEAAHDVLATLWARLRVDDLISQDWNGIERGEPKREIRDAITKLGLEYRLLTRFTSFVAVEESVVTEGGITKTIEVPVEMPDGVSYEGIFGDARREVGATGSARKMALQSTAYRQNEPRKAAAPSGLGGFWSRAGIREREELRERDEAAVKKLHPDLERLTRGEVVAGLTAADGMVAVEIWLAEATPEALATLKRLGFKPMAESRFSKVVIGRVPVEKLERIGALSTVLHVAPYRGR